MYNNKILPQTGAAVGTGIFGVSAGCNIAIGICLVITGIVITKAIRFKIKEKKL